MTHRLTPHRLNNYEDGSEYTIGRAVPKQALLLSVCDGAASQAVATKSALPDRSSAALVGQGQLLKAGQGPLNGYFGDVLRVWRG